jgi:4-hydroxybenzoate polyprenyltransferase
MGKKVFIFFINSNLFVACCAFAMVFQTSHLLLEGKHNSNFLFFVFFSTITSYSFHWYLTTDSVIPSPRIEWLKRNRNIHLILFIAGISAAGIFFLYLPPYWHWLLLSAFITFLYSAPKINHPFFRFLRKIAVGKTLFLALVWTFVTTILPIEIAEMRWKEEFTFFTAHRFFLIYAICILFDYRDREDDKKAGVRSLISYLSEKNISRLFYLAMLLFFTSTTLLYKNGFDLLTVLILLLPGIIIVSLYSYARKNFSDTLYYFVLDGLMALSSLIMLVQFI